MTFLTFSAQTMNNCQPTVEMVLNWIKREYKAKVKVQKVRKSDECTYLIESAELPEGPICVSCIELMPGIVRIKIQKN